MSSQPDLLAQEPSFTLERNRKDAADACDGRILSTIGRLSATASTLTTGSGACKAHVSTVGAATGSRTADDPAMQRGIVVRNSAARLTALTSIHPH